QHRLSLCERIDDEAAEDLLHRIQIELEGGDDAEVAAAAADSPEQIGLILLVDPSQQTVGSHDLGGSKAARSRAVPARQPSDAAAERVAGHANRPGEAVERREPVRMRGGN